MSVIQPAKIMDAVKSPAARLALYTVGSQLLLAQTTNLTYVYRDWLRQTETPDNRRADYLFRHFIGATITPFVMETMFRAAETIFTIPAFVKLLELDKVYAGKGLPRILWSKMLGGLPKAKSNYLIPNLVQTDINKMPDATAEQRAAKEKEQVLHQHLLERLNYSQYLQDVVFHPQYGQVGTADQARLLRLVDRHFKDQLSRLTETAAYKVSKPAEQKSMKLAWAVNQTVEKYHKEFVEAQKNAALKNIPVSKKLQDKTSKQFSNYFNQLLNSHKNSDPFLREAGQKVQELVFKGMRSKHLLGVLEKVQKSSFWAKMSLFIIFSTLEYFFGFSKIDLKYVQPWQKRLVKERGSSKEVEKPVYLSMIPGLLTFFSLYPLLKRTGYFNRILLSSIAGLGVYAASSFYLIKKALAKPPKYLNSSNNAQAEQQKPSLQTNYSPFATKIPAPRKPLYTTV